MSYSGSYNSFSFITVLKLGSVRTFLATIEEVQSGETRDVGPKGKN